MGPHQSFMMSVMFPNDDEDHNLKVVVNNYVGGWVEMLHDGKNGHAPLEHFVAPPQMYENLLVVPIVWLCHSKCILMVECPKLFGCPQL